MNLPNNEKTIWNALIDAGYEAFLVGGAVRDIILGQTPKDFDFATNATPEQITDVFGSFDNHKHFKLDFVGASFGVMLINGVEVATFRGDRYFGGGDKDVKISYVDTIEEDLARRDFTVNAMAMNTEGNVVDPFGGCEDLVNKLIRFVGNPVDRINEDPNRILRALRFASRFDFIVEFDTWNSIVMAVEDGKIDMVAPERIRLELIKVMESTKKASVFWDHALFSGVLGKILPEMVKGWLHDHGNHHNEDIWTHNMLAGDHISTDNPLLKLAGYLHDVGKPASYDEKLGTFYEHQHFGADIVRERLTALKFSNDEIRYVVNLVLIHMDGTRGMSAKARRRLKNKLNAYDLEWTDYLTIRTADRHGNTTRPDFTEEQIQDYVDMFEIEEEVPFSVNDLALSGGELIRIFNLTPGPIVGKIQREMLKMVIDDGEEWNERITLIGFIINEFKIEPSVDIFD